MSVAAGRESDTDLAHRAGAGDQVAFAALYDRYFGELYDFATRTPATPDATAVEAAQALRQVRASAANGKT